MGGDGARAGAGQRPRLAVRAPCSSVRLPGFPLAGFRASGWRDFETEKSGRCRRSERPRCYSRRLREVGSAHRTRTVTDDGGLRSGCSQHIIDLWEEGGQLLALIELIPVSDHLLIENIAVRPDQQGKGLGGKLLHHAERVARSLGLDEIQLYTNAAFASNLSFYSQRGYQEYRRGTVVPGSVTVFMRRKIEVSG